MHSLVRLPQIPYLFRRNAKPRSPRELYGVLFIEAQRAHATLDNKVFADAEPRMSTRAILKAY